MSGSTSEREDRVGKTRTDSQQRGADFWKQTIDAGRTARPPYEEKQVASEGEKPKLPKQ